MQKLDRYRSYYLLLDISFALQVAFIVTELMEWMVGRRILWGAFQPLGIGLFCFALIVPAFLVFARWMRDEFTETLWRATAGTVLKAMIILPIPVALVAAGFAGAAVHDDITTVPGTLDTVTTSKFLGMAMAIAWMWLITPVVFTFAFQWHRWRASR